MCECLRGGGSREGVPEVERRCGGGRGSSL